MQNKDKSADKLTTDLLGNSDITVKSAWIPVTLAD
jgi:hypothetical protein